MTLKQTSRPSPPRYAIIQGALVILAGYREVAHLQSCFASPWARSAGCRPARAWGTSSLAATAWLSASEPERGYLPPGDHTLELGMGSEVDVDEVESSPSSWLVGVRGKMR